MAGRMSIATTRRGYVIGIVALAALFFLLCLPLLPSVSRWRGDERFYTDAVIGMTQSGHYATPTYSDGTLRFKKPILAYWVVLLSYKTLGINYLASRLPFLVAGTLVVWLTYRLGLLLVRRRPEALVASAIMASNLTVLHTTIRSTPDMLLTFFITLSMVGFASLVFRKTRPLHAYVLAYLGVALAVATKGLFGVLPVLFVIGYVKIAKLDGVRLKDLLHGPVLLATLPVALAWFVWAFAQHGVTAASDFWGDQVGERFSGSKWYILSNAGIYLASLVVQLLPWAGLALVPLYHGFRKRWDMFSGHRREVAFMLGWIVVLYVVFIFGNIQRTRYFLPAYPFLSILYAMLLCAGFRQDSIRLTLIKVLRVLCECVLIWGAILVVGGLRIHSDLIIAGLIFSACSLVLIRQFSRWAPPVAMTGFGMLLVIFFSLTDILVRPGFFVSPAPAMTEAILAQNPAGGEVAMAGVSLNYVSQVRVLSEGRINPVDVTETSTPTVLAKYAWLVCPKPDFEKRTFGDGELVGTVSGVSGWRPKDFLALMSSRRRGEVWAQRRQEYALVRLARP